MVKALFDLTPLFSALESGQTVITANDRLRRHLLKAWGEHQQSLGLKAWIAPPVYPLNRWLESRWQYLLERGHAGCQKAIAQRHQRQWIWEQVIGTSSEGEALLQPEPLAQQADAALRSLILWDILPESLANGLYTQSDTQAFLRWLAAFEARLESRQLVTPEAAHKLIAEAFDSGDLPREQSLWLFGFDDLPPLHQRILNLAAENVIPTAAGKPEQVELRRTIAADQETELRSAALWSLAQIERDPEAVVGIIVPDLGQRRDQVERVFAEVFEPTATLPDYARYTLPFNFSAGVPLGGTPLIHSALSLLALNREQWPVDELCKTLFSPFWSQAETEWILRTQLSERLRKLGKFELTGSDLRFHSQQLSDRQAKPTATVEPEIETGELVQPSKGVTNLAQRLQQFDEYRRRLSRSISARRWVDAFRAQLDILGWPGTRRLDSQEYQQLGQWHELLETFASLEATGSDLSLSQALKLLSQLATQTPFQAQTPDSPIQILGILEGAGLRFSHCWVLGLHQRQWPPVPAPNPLLPIDLQRQNAMPHASAERELSIAHSLTENYRACARDVVFSSPCADDQGDLSVSPLIRAIPETPLVELVNEGISPHQRYLKRLADSRQLESVDSAHGPAVDTREKAPGGSGLFKHQAACPFNAFAQLRLGAREPDAPVLGLSPAERGTVLHAVLAAVWKQLGDSTQLLSIDPSTLDEMIHTYCHEALQPIKQRRPRELGPVYCALEEERLHAVVSRWLELEKDRPPFEVIGTEERRDIEFSGLKLTLFIDRIDRLENGELLLIDYKTGADLNPRQWLGERPDEPQLPLYAVSQPSSAPPVKGIAFAQLHPKALQWIGLGELSQAPLGIKPTNDDWSEQLAEWDQVLTHLAQDFISGDARVDFKDAKAQRYSEHLTPLNRALETEAVREFITDQNQSFREER